MDLKSGMKQFDALKQGINPGLLCLCLHLVRPPEAWWHSFWIMQ
jgi:hypothetical protein